MKTREQLIFNMCLTWRHDYGLIKDTTDILSSGMTIDERNALWNRMAQLYDNVIQPHLDVLTNK